MPLYIIPRDGGARNLIVCIPKPPKLGSACVPKPRVQDPDQDWVQKALLHRGVTGNQTKRKEN